MKECYLYQKLQNKKVQCKTCPHYCLINSQRKGICGVRENKNGKLYLLAYNKATALNIDPIEKKPLYKFLPRTQTLTIATLGCNLRCPWCQNYEISQAPKEYGFDFKTPFAGYNLKPQEIVKLALEKECPSISYSYTEPTIFLEYALDTMKIAHKAGLKNIWVSNGYFSPQTWRLIKPHLDAINIDLKTLNPEKFQKFCGGKIKPILTNLKKISKSKIHLEMTTLIVPKFNDQTTEIKQIARFIAQELDKEIPWHISRYYPAYKYHQSTTSIRTLEKAAQIGKKAGLKYVYLGNI